MRERKLRALCLGMLMMCPLVACGDDDGDSKGGAQEDASAQGRDAEVSADSDAGKTDDSKPEASKPDASAHVEEPEAQTGVAYTLMIRDPEGFSEYLIGGKDVPKGTVETKTAVELRGGNWYYTDEAAYYDNWDRGSLQRYELRCNYKLELAGELSYQNFTSTNGPIFVNAHVAYFLDGLNGVITRFDPTSMEITGTIDASELAPGDGWTMYTNFPERVGDRWLASVGFYHADATLLPPKNAVAIITDDDAHPIRLIYDDRFAYRSTGSASDADGNFYVLTDQGYPDDAFAQKRTPEPRLVRVKRDADEIDRDFEINVAELLNLKTPWVNCIRTMRDNKVAIQAWQSEIKPEDVFTKERTSDVLPYYDWYLIDLETREVKKFSGVPSAVISYDLLHLYKGTQLYLQNWVLPDYNYELGRVEIYAAHEDGSAEKVFESTRGDIRFMGEIKIIDRN